MWIILCNYPPDPATGFAGASAAGFFSGEVQEVVGTTNPLGAGWDIQGIDRVQPQRKYSCIPGPGVYNTDSGNRR